MSPKTANEWIALLGTLLGFGVASWLYSRRAFRRLLAIRWLSKQPWREVFGDKPVESIRDILTDLGNAQDIIEARQQVACRKLGIGIYICDASNGACIYTNDLLAEIFGVTPVEMLGFGWASQVIEREEKVRTWEYCCQRRITYRDSYAVKNALTGKMVFLRTEAHYIASGGGRYVGWVEVVIR